MTMLAETIATGVNWSLIASLVMAAFTALMWWDARRKPVELAQPVQTTKVWPSATLKDLESNNAEVQRRLAEHDLAINALRELIRVELPAMERRITTENEHRAVQLHNRINEILEAVSELRGQVTSRN